MMSLSWFCRKTLTFSREKVRKNSMIPERVMLRVCSVVLFTVVCTIGVVTSVQADGGHGYDRDRFYSPHWELDMRHRHDHYYPARGYIVPTLPPGYLDLTF